MLPSSETGPVVDIGCGEGELVRLIVADGYDPQGLDISPDQVAIAQASGLNQVQQGDYRDIPGARSRQFAAVTAIDLLEHLTKDEVVTALDHVAAALALNAVFVARVPNAVSPFGRKHPIRGLHARILVHRAQRPTASRRDWVRFRHSAVLPPVARGLVSTMRLVVWKNLSALCKLALATETGSLRRHIGHPEPNL